MLQNARHFPKVATPHPFLAWYATPLLSYATPLLSFLYFFVCQQEDRSDFVVVKLCESAALYSV
jgi:hypothetical protein